MPTSILSRKLDLLYLTFFLIHIPVMFCVDLVPLYPSSLHPHIQPLLSLRQWYITTFHDQFFVSPPAWFTMYMYMELLYHVPLSLYAISALIRDDPKIPVHLLIYAIQTAITTATCIADYLSWKFFSHAEKLELAKLYVPYLILSVFMGVDMYARLDAALSKRAAMNATKKSE